MFMFKIVTNFKGRAFGDFVIEGTTNDDYNTLCSALYDIISNALRCGFNPEELREALKYAKMPIYLREKEKGKKNGLTS